MRRVALMGLLLASACPASERPVVRETTPVRSDLRPFLWQVDGPNGPSYLMGTFHIGVAASDVFPPSVWDKLERCDAVVFEMNTRSLEALGLGMLPEGETLDQKMTPHQWTELLGALKLSEQSADKIKGVKVWLLYASVLHELVPETKPIDTEVEERARAANRRVVFLESVKEQERILERHQTIEDLLKLLGNMDAARKSLEREIQVYKSGDERRFAELTLRGDEYDDSFLQEVVYKRNEAWIPVLETEMKKGCLFLVVGASHLVGENSVVQLLRNRGYRVTRIRG